MLKTYETSTTSDHLNFKHTKIRNTYMMFLQGRIELPSLGLTPHRRMRKKRPSYSPVKNANFETPASRGYSSNPSTSQKLANLSSTDNEALDTGFASLQFEEFTWDDGNGGYRGVGAADFTKLNTYMKELYPEVVVIEERVPYLVVWCTGSVPEPSKRPFLIAGLLGVWLVDGPDNLPREFIGDDLGSTHVVLEIAGYLAEDIRENNIPKTETLCRLMRDHFPNALALSFVNNEILVELPELPTREYWMSLTTLPGRFSHTEVLLMYHNGLRITGHQNKRLKQPMPQTVDGQCDDSDYVATQGNFQPGSMLCDDSGSMVSAGILLEKDNERRLTVSIHCWQKELDEIPEMMGDSRFFRVTQGKTYVGHVSSRVGNTEIGLATLNDNIEFRNRFIDLPGGPTKLLHSNMLKSNEVYIIDSFTTGRQGGMLCKGKRVIKQEEKENRVDRILLGKQKDLPDAGTYMVLVQGIFATSEPMAYGEPIIRAGCCGSPIVRLIKTTEPRDGGKGTPDKQGSSNQGTPSTKGTPGKGDSSTPKYGNPNPAASAGLGSKKVELGFVNDGEIAGFMHWSDLQEKTAHANIPRLFCYAEVTDSLIDVGWEVVKTTEKRKRTDSEDPFVD